MDVEQPTGRRAFRRRERPPVVLGRVGAGGGGGGGGGGADVEAKSKAEAELAKPECVPDERTVAERVEGHANTADMLLHDSEEAIEDGVLVEHPRVSSAEAVEDGVLVEHPRVSSAELVDAGVLVEPPRVFSRRNPVTIETKSRKFVRRTRKVEEECDEFKSAGDCGGDSVLGNLPEGSEDSAERAEPSALEQLADGSESGGDVKTSGAAPVVMGHQLPEFMSRENVKKEAGRTVGKTVAIEGASAVGLATTAGNVPVLGAAIDAGFEFYDTRDAKQAAAVGGGSAAGSASGATAGVIIGSAVGGPPGAFLGTIVGGAAGGFIGKRMARSEYRSYQQRKLKEQEGELEEQEEQQEEEEEEKGQKEQKEQEEQEERKEQEEQQEEEEEEKGQKEQEEEVQQQEQEQPEQQQEEEEEEKGQEQQEEQKEQKEQLDHESVQQRS